MDPHPGGGWCPRCDGEFEPGIAECPDCGIPLEGIEARPAAAPAVDVAEPPPLTLDPGWADRLTVIAAACDLAVLLVVIGAAISAFALDDQFGGAAGNRYQRITIFTRAASPGLALVVVVAAVAVAVTRRLRNRTSRDTAAQRATFGAAALLLVMAIVGAWEEWRDNPSNSGWQQQASSISAWLAVGVLVVAAGWITGAVGAADDEALP